MSLDVFSQFQADLKTGAIAAGIVAAQITLGHWEQPAPVVVDDKVVVDNLWEDVAKNGFYLFIEPPKSHTDFVSRNGQFQLKAKLLGSFPANVSDNLTALQMQHAKLIDAWANMLMPWNDGGNRQPVAVDHDLEYVWHENPYILIMVYTIHGVHVAGQTASPYLVPAV